MSSTNQDPLFGAVTCARQAFSGKSSELGEVTVMLCPLCSHALKPVERQGVEIDYCVQCGGIWLDQGELTELIRRETVDALVKGQDVLMSKRRDREYDRMTEAAVSMAVSSGSR